MIRADLEWSLKAVLPHIGRTSQTDWIGFDSKDGETYVYATDKYTAGVARVAGSFPAGWMQQKEAAEMMRFVRPGRVAEQAEEVVYARRPGELHIGVGDETAVFDTLDVGQPLSVLFDLITRLRDSEPEWDELIVQPKLVEKFGKAQRADFERLRFHPRRHGDLYGAAVVTVGSDFIGTVAGMVYDDLGPSLIDDFIRRAA